MFIVLIGVHCAGRNWIFNKRDVKISRAYVVESVTTCFDDTECLRRLNEDFYLLIF